MAPIGGDLLVFGSETHDTERAETMEDSTMPVKRSKRGEISFLI